MLQGKRDDVPAKTLATEIVLDICSPRLPRMRRLSRHAELDLPHLCKVWSSRVSIPTETEVLNISSSLLGVESKYLQVFSATDPFNTGNVVEGSLCRKPNHLYGALAIVQVNGEPCHQTIYATPKLHYPFGKDGSFHFPPVKDIHIYEKLDGTNVTAYSYASAQGDLFRSYKLRLSPFLRNGKWGEFLDMWKGLLEKCPEAKTIGHSDGLNVSFEMYGSKNEHLIKYNNELDLSLLFAVHQDSARLAAPYELDSQGCPTPRLLGRISCKENPIEAFSRLRGEMEDGNTSESDGKIKGTEGAVWYIRSPSGATSMWKCKPESVEQIHWATGINKEAVMATCWNLLESSDHLNYENLLPLLLEEYQEDDIIRFRPHIDNCVKRVSSDQEFRTVVKSAYNVLKGDGLDIKKDKSEVMRALSRQFPREQMTKVYTALSK